MTTKRKMPGRRAERQRDIPDPSVPPPPPKGKRGAGVAKIRRSKEPLKGGKKVK